MGKMKMKEKNRTFFRGSLIAACVLLLLVIVAIWPLKMVKTEYLSKNESDSMSVSEPLMDYRACVQEFVPKYNHILMVEPKFYVTGERGDAYVLFELYDEDLNVIFETNIPASEIESGVSHQVMVNMDVTKGKTYYYKTTVYDNPDVMICVYYTPEKFTDKENRTMFIGQNIIEGSSITRYTYKDLSLADAERYILYVVMAGTAVITLLIGMGRKLLEDEEKEEGR